MKIIDNIPIFIVVAAILTNIAIGVKGSINFSILMIRCMIVTIVFGIFGYMITETIKNAIEWNSLSKHGRDKDGEAKALEENKSVLDIKVPPLDDEELMNMDINSDDDFVEVNPVFMGNYNKSEED
jgi:hypothetical protein